MMAPLEYFVRGTNFNARELAPVGKQANGNGPALKVPPLALVQNILPTLRVAQDVREHFGQPVTVLSGYRDPIYNRAVGGASESMHVAFNAMDISVADVDPSAVASWLLRHTLAPWMGIGLYVQQGFVHLDTRGLLSRTAPARFGGEGEPRWW